MRRKSRLFALAEHLRARKTGVTAEALAERFGVSVRTIYRDLDSLREAALPLQADRGRGGGYALDRNYSLPPVNFTAREAAVLDVLGRHAVAMRLLPFEEIIDRALDKVRGALSVSAQRDLAKLAERIHILGVPAQPTLPSVRRAVEQAWFEQRALEIAYRSRSRGYATHRVRIDSVVTERSFSVLQCRNEDTGELRGYRLDRIEKARVI